MKYIIMIKRNKKSVKSLNPCPSVIQTINDIVKAHGGEINVATQQNDGTAFTILLPINEI